VFLGNREVSDIEVSAPHAQPESELFGQGFEKSSIVSILGFREFEGSIE
jgi:hypothetical protein